MSSRWALILVCVLLVGSMLHAEPETIYELRMPTADEYLAAIPALLDQAKLDYPELGYDTPYTHLISLTEAEFKERYSPLSNQSYHLLAGVFEYYIDPYTETISKDILAAWLRENPVDLDDFDLEHPLQFGKFIVKVTPRDFNGDGQHEWILDIDHDQIFTWQEVVTRTAPGRYQEIKTPLFMFNKFAHYTSASLAQELAFEDLNHDGLPEWVIAIGGAGGGHQNHGYLFILQWQEGQLVNLAPIDRISYSAPAGGGSPLFPFGVTVDLKDTDDNGTIDIQVSQEQQFDNWGCTWTNLRIFGWKESQYSLLEESRRDDPVIGCAWRAAETALWESDYLSAIASYSHASTMRVPHDSIGSYDHELWEYEQVRWALAYLLNAQPTEAQQVLETLQAVGMQSGTVQQMHEILEHMIGTSASADDICQAMYDVWQGYLDNADTIYKKYQAQYRDEPIYVGYEDVISLDAYVGYITENYSIPNISGFAFPAPEKAGCDISAYGRSLSVDEAPSQIIEILPAPTIPTAVYHPPYPMGRYQVLGALWGKDKDSRQFLIQARFWLLQVQQGLTEGDEWEARYFFATALRQNNRNEEALAQYVYLYENSPYGSWRQLAGLYLRPVEGEQPASN